jgi:intein/homing endonuclease
MKTFIYKNGRPDHIEGYHDDCLKKGTLIKTIEGYKPIEDIRVGDLVLTHLGRYKEVEACLEKPFNGEWYDLKFQGMLNLGLSYNHPLYSAPNTYKNKNNPDYKKRDWVLPSEWAVNKQNNKKGRRQVSIKENLPDNNNTILKYDDFRIKENNEYNNNITELILDTNFAKFLGLFLADGHAPKIDKEYQGNKYYTMSLAFNVRDEELCNEMIAYLKSININSRKSKVVGNGFMLNFSSKFLSGILSYCYDKNREKILPYYAHNLGKDLSYVLDYWIKGDGWVDNKHGYDFIAASTSKQLALSMMDIAWSVGRYATISLHPRKRYDVKNKDQYWVNIRNTYKSQDRLKLISDFEYGNKSVTINKTTYNGTVYNLQVKDDESFIADGIVVHNCIMSLGMGLWVLQSSFKSLKKSNEQTKAMLSSWIVGGADNSMSSTIDVYDPNKNKKVTKINPSHSAYRNVQDPNGDYLWLFSGLK